MHQVEQNQREMDQLLHRLWTKAVGTKDYDKKEWQALEQMIWVKLPLTKECKDASN